MATIDDHEKHDDTAFPSSASSLHQGEKHLGAHDDKETASLSGRSFHSGGDVERGASAAASGGPTAPALSEKDAASPSLNDAPVNDPMLVEFDGPDDPEDPKNWPVLKRVGATAATALMTFVVTFASSIFSVAIQPVSEEFHIGMTVSTLGVSLFLLGFVLGPIVFGPASEVFGRRAPMLLGYIVFAIFQIPVAVARNTATIMVCRFIGGFAACAPLSILGGVVADLWPPVERAYAVCLLAFSAFSGPVAGPVVGGFVTQSYLGWRWTAWLTLIAAGSVAVLGFFLIPETSGQRILQLKARRRRKATGNANWRAKADENPITLQRFTTVYLVRPWKMLTHEPILALLTAYMSFLYGLMYLMFEAFPVSFHDQRGWNLGVSALPFCSFIVGTGIGCAIMAYTSATSFKRAYIKHGVAIPEARLPPMFIGAIVLPIGFFWFGWTSYPTITWVPQVISVALIGMGEVVTFWVGMAYMIDCYGFYSNSAIAVNTFIRSIAGAVFPLFAVYMYEGIGVPWASSLVGFLSLVFIPAPFLFYKYGAKIRAKSRWTPTG